MDGAGALAPDWTVDYFLLSSFDISYTFDACAACEFPVLSAFLDAKRLYKVYIGDRIIEQTARNEQLRWLLVEHSSTSVCWYFPPLTSRTHVQRVSFRHCWLSRTLGACYIYDRTDILSDSYDITRTFSL